MFNHLMNSPRAVTISSQRSGTKFFGDSLKSGDLFHSFGEVMHTSLQSRKGNLISYARRNNIDVFGMTTKEIFGFLDEYFDHLGDLSNGKRPHIDLMYNSLGGISGAWEYPKQTPLFMHYFQIRRFSVIHIVRESLYDAFLSTTVRQKTGIAHSHKLIDHGRLEVEIELGPLRNFVKGCLQARRLVRETYSGEPFYTEVTYPHFLKDISAMTKRGGAESRLFGQSSLKPTTDRTRVVVRNEAAARAVVQDIYDQDM